MFAHLTTALQCEVAGLGHLRAALFAFATALVAANTLSAVRAALRGVHGIEVEERVSMYHLVNDLQNSYGFIRLVEDEVPWETYTRQPVQDLTRRLTDVVKQMDLWRYPKAKKRPRVPNRPVRGRPDDPPHVSTYQLLQAEKRSRVAVLYLDVYLCKKNQNVHIYAYFQQNRHSREKRKKLEMKRIVTRK